MLHRIHLVLVHLCLLKNVEALALIRKGLDLRLRVINPQLFFGIFRFIEDVIRRCNFLRFDIRYILLAERDLFSDVAFWTCGVTPLASVKHAALLFALSMTLDCILYDISETVIDLELEELVDVDLYATFCTGAEWNLRRFGKILE